MECVKIIHILTDPTRFRLLQLLSEHHYCVKALAKKLGISEPAVSQHMRILKKYQIVQGVKIGYQTHYQVDRDRVLALFDELSQQISHYPLNTMITNDWECSCEFVSECMKRDAKILEEQGYGK